MRSFWIARVVLNPVMSVLIRDRREDTDIGRRGGYVNTETETGVM